MLIDGVHQPSSRRQLAVNYRLGSDKFSGPALLMVCVNRFHLNSSPITSHQYVLISCIDLDKEIEDVIFFNSKKVPTAAAAVARLAAEDGSYHSATRRAARTLQSRNESLLIVECLQDISYETGVLLALLRPRLLLLLLLVGRLLHNASLRNAIDGANWRLLRVIPRLLDVDHST